jgi:hypothetical protein
MVNIGDTNIKNLSKIIAGPKDNPASALVRTSELAEVTPFYSETDSEILIFSAIRSFLLLHFITLITQQTSSANKLLLLFAMLIYQTSINRSSARCQEMCRYTTL